MRLLIAILTLLSVSRAEIADADLDKLSKAEIIATVKHLAQLTDDAKTETAKAKEQTATAEAKADTAIKQSIAAQLSEALAKADGEKLQTTVNTLTTERNKAITERDHEKALKWKWFFAWLGTVLLVVGFFIARQYIPILKLL